MGEKPIVGSLLSLAGAFLLLAGSLFVSNPVIFFGSVVSGLLNLAFGVMLYRKPGKHSLWSTGLIAVSIFDLLGVVFFFYASSAEAFDVYRNSRNRSPDLPHWRCGGAPMEGYTEGTICRFDASS